MAAKINWSDRSIRNLNHIHDFIAYDSAVYANRFVKSLVLAAEKQLRDYPLIGRPVPEFQNTPLSFLREVIFKGYRIIYNPVSVEEIIIIAVISGRMDLFRSDWEIE